MRRPLARSLAIMRVSVLCAASVLVTALANGAQIDAPTFVSGEVSVYQANISRSMKWKLSPKQLVELRQWLTDRKSDWSAVGKMPPETMVVLADADGKTFHLRVTGNAVMANGKVKGFSEKEISHLKSILGVNIVG